MRLSLVCAILAVFAAAPLLAGEDVELLDARGSACALPDANSRATCGACHDDFETKARSVHFERGNAEVDLGAADCLACHSGKLTSSGHIDKTRRIPRDQDCQACHEVMATTKHQAHSGMSCHDCHKDAGHEKAKAASCEGCHDGSTKAPKPTHTGFTKLHMDRISCEACHVRGDKLGYVLTKGRISPVDADGAAVHHGVAIASGALSCPDCHSNGSSFFFGTTNTGRTDSKGNPVMAASFKSMGLSRGMVDASIIRESVIKPYSLWLFLVILVLCALHYVVFGPRRVKIPPDDTEVHRFSAAERAVHLTALGSFVLLAFTGIAFLLRLDSPTSALRAIHGGIGVVFGASVVGLIVAWWRHGMFVQCDLQWIKSFGGYLWIKEECPAEKFNAGQKLFFWGIAVFFGLLVSTSGILLIAGKGAAPGWVFTLHDLAAVIVMVGILAHAYLSILANPGTIHSMLTGRVKRAWAKHHHPLWYKRHFGE